MHPPYRLRKYIAHLQDLQLRTPRLMLRLIHRIRDNYLIQRTGINPLNRIAAENAVRNQRIHLRRALLLQQLRGARNGVGGIGQVVDEDGGAVRDVPDEHHGGVLAVGDLCWAPLFVDEGKGHAEGVGDGGCAFGATCIGADDDGLLVVGDVELDVFAQQVAAVEVVDGDVEEALVLGVW